MTLPNTNPTIECGIQVGCCPQELPQTLKATITSASGCTSLSTPVDGDLAWFPAGDRWQGAIAVCGVDVNLYLACDGSGANSFAMGGDWDDTGTCMGPFPFDRTSAQCKTSSQAFKLVFDTTIGPILSDCPCCVDEDVSFTVEITE